jgi:hypothetical protein
MISAFLFSVGHNPAVSVRAGIVAVLVACVPGLAVAGAQNIPCSRPFIFQGAAVNVVVLPYTSAPGLATAGGIGDRLSGLLQLEVLRAIAKFGSVGAVQMVGSAADCDPDLVVAKLLGRTPGAAATVRKGHGLVVVWGRFYTERGNVFVQTFCRLLRSGIDETFELVAGGRPFSAQISAQAFACAPRKVTVADMANFEEQFLRSTIVRTAPQESASGNRMPSGPQPYWISDTQGDWMKIAAQNGLQGWIRLSGARDSWSLARWLPELTYIEGIVGYLRVRIAAQQSIPVRAEWVANATRAFSEYEATLDPQTKAPPEAGTLSTTSANWRTALSVAVQLQLRGILAATKPQATADDRVNAMNLFERATAMLQRDGSARNLLAVMQLSLAFGSSYPGLSPKRTADDLLQALSTDPGNPRLLANLRSAYEALLAQSASGASPLTPLTDEERRTVSERLDAIRQLRPVKPG